MADVAIIARVAAGMAPRGIYTRLLALDGEVLSERQQVTTEDADNASKADEGIIHDAGQPVVVCTYDGDTGVLMSAVTFERAAYGIVAPYPTGRRG